MPAICCAICPCCLLCRILLSTMDPAFAKAVQTTQGDFVLQQKIHPAATGAPEEAPQRHWGDWGTL